MTPITVTHIITKLELGGAQQVALFTVSHLDPARFRPILIAGEPGYLDQEARALSPVAFYQVPSLVRPISPFMDIRALISLARLLARLRPTIVHTHSSKAGIVGRWAARVAKVPIIVHSVHGFGFTPDQHPLKRRLLVGLERQTGRFTNRFFVVSEANRRLGIRLGIFSEGQSAVLRPGIDTQLFRWVHSDSCAIRRDLGLDPRRPVVGMVAPLKPQKAPLDFVRLAARVTRERPDAQFVLVGDGELRGVVERERARLGLTEGLRLLGWRRDIPEIMRCLDVFVLTSRWEGLPRVYLEARTSGVPVVGTRVDGAPEVIDDGVNGYLCEPGDVDSMSQRLLSLLNHPDKARQMGRNGQSLPPEFDIWNMIRQQEQEYEQLLA